MPPVDPSVVPLSSSTQVDERLPIRDNEVSPQSAPVEAVPTAPAASVADSPEVPTDVVPQQPSSPAALGVLPPVGGRARITRALPPGSNDLAKRAAPTSLPYALASRQIKNREYLHVLRMLRSGLLKDLDERGPGGLTLLGHLSDCSDAQKIPSWNEWAADPKLAWAACLADKKHWSDPTIVGAVADEVGRSGNILAASLIFAGANPWIGWTRQTKDNASLRIYPVSSLTTADNVLSGAVDSFNAPLTRLLLSHPGCPPAAEIDRLRVFNVSLPHPGRQSSHHGYYGNSENLPDEPFLHLLVATNNIPMVKMFLDKGCDINQVNSSERSPLFYAHTTEMVQLLLERGASVDLVDEAGHTVDAFWNNYIGTSAARAPVMGLLIKHMSTIKTPQELIDHQKPALFATVLSGTKTDFETIFRKSKFSADVTWDRGDRGSWSLLTAALVRRDEKTRLFTNFLAAGKNAAPKNHDILPGAGDRHLALMTGVQHDFEAANAYPDPGKSRSDLAGVSPMVHQAFRDSLVAAPILAKTGLDRGASLSFILACLTGADLTGAGELSPGNQNRQVRVIGRDGSWLVNQPSYNTLDRNIQELFDGSFPSGDMGRQFRKILISLSEPTRSEDRDLLFRSASQSFLNAIAVASARSLRTGTIAKGSINMRTYVSDRADLMMRLLAKLEKSMVDDSATPMPGEFAIIALGYAFNFDVFTSHQVSGPEAMVVRAVRDLPAGAWSLDVAKTMKTFVEALAVANSNASIHGDLFGVITSQAERVLLSSAVAGVASSETDSSPPVTRRRM